MYVDPNRLVLTLTQILLIFIINVFVTWSKKIFRKWRRIQWKLPQSGVKITQIRRFERSSGVPIGRGVYTAILKNYTGSFNRKHMPKLLNNKEYCSKRYTY